eukprot:SAG31_NODE_1547_length_7925_cov_3.563251_2_plen_77_part_00
MRIWQLLSEVAEVVATDMAERVRSNRGEREYGGSKANLGERGWAETVHTHSLSSVADEAVTAGGLDRQSVRYAGGT